MSKILHDTVAAPDAKLPMYAGEVNLVNPLDSYIVAAYQLAVEICGSTASN
jgi:hypothetical protein